MMGVLYAGKPVCRRPMAIVGNRPDRTHRHAARGIRGDDSVRAARGTEYSKLDSVRPSSRVRTARAAALLVNNINRLPLSVEAAAQFRFRLSGSHPSSTGMGLDVLPKSSRSFPKIHDGQWRRSERTWRQPFRASAALKLRQTGHGDRTPAASCFIEIGDRWAGFVLTSVAEP